MTYDEDPLRGTLEARARAASLACVRQALGLLTALEAKDLQPQGEKVYRDYLASVLQNYEFKATVAGVFDAEEGLCEVMVSMGRSFMEFLAFSQEEKEGVMEEVALFMGPALHPLVAEVLAPLYVAPQASVRDLMPEVTTEAMAAGEGVTSLGLVTLYLISRCSPRTGLTVQEHLASMGRNFALREEM